MTFSDETLMAYVDGELDAAARGAVEAALASDPELARRISRQRALRERLRQEFAPVLEEPLPERLLAAARGTAATAHGGEVIPLRRTPPARWAWPQWAAMAASLALGVFIAPLLWRPAGPIELRAGQVVASGTLAHALSEQLASRQGAGAPVHIDVSFLARTGNYCRTFRLRDQSALAGLACREQDHWRLEALLASPAASGASGEYRPAASPTPPGIERAVDELIVGEPLDASAEANARAKGWRR